MSENDDTIQVPQLSTFETLSYLANQLPTNPDDPRQLETYANELTTNVITDATETASRNHSENFDNTNELNSPQTSKQNQSENPTTALDKSEYSTTNGIHNENDFDYEDIQKKINGVIQDIQSRSPDDTARKSITSNHLHDDQINNSTPISNDPTQSPIRSMSESALVDQHITNEQSLPVPIRQDESLSDVDDMFGIKAGPVNTTSTIDDSIDQYRSEQENQRNNQIDNNDEFFNTKTATIDDDQQPTNINKQTDLDETTRFGTTSTSRVQSASSKRSVRMTQDEPSTSGDEKRTQMSPSKLPDDTGNDTDRDNQEVAIIARRPSRAISPLNRPRSPTPNDSRKVSISNEPPSSTFLAERSASPANLRTDDDTNHSPGLSDDNQQKQIFESPTAIISPASRRESTNKIDQQQTSPPASANKTKFDDDSFERSISRAGSRRTSQFIPTDEQSKLIKPGVQLQIPIDDLDNERLDNPSPLSTDIKSLALINPLLGSTLVQNEQDQSEPSSETNRKSPTTSMISNEKIIDGDVISSKSRRESNISQQQTNNTDQKATSRRESQVIDQTPQISSSRRVSGTQQQDELDSHREQPVASRRTSTVPQEPTSHRGSFVSEQQISSRRESVADEQKMAGRKGSTVSEQQPPSKRGSIAPEQQISSRRESTTNESQVSHKRGSIAPEQHISSRRESTNDEQKIGNRRGSTTFEQQVFNRRESTADEQRISSRRGSVAFEQQVSNRRESTADEQKIPSRRGSIVFEQKPSSRKESTASEQQVSTKRESIVPEQQTSSQRKSVADEQQTTSRKGSTVSEQQPPSKRGSIAPEQQISSRRESTNDGQKTFGRRESTNDEQKTANRRDSTTFEQQESSKRESPAPELQVSSRRESHVPDQQISYHRQNSSDEQEQKFPSKPASRKTSVAEQQQQHIPSRRESQQQVSSSRRTSTNRDNQPLSPRRSSKVHISSSPESSRRNSVIKQEQQPIPVVVNKDNRRSSLKITDTNHQQVKHEPHSSYKEVLTSDTDDVPIRTTAKHKQERTLSIDKRQKSSSTVDENDHRRSSFQRRSGQESKRNSNMITDQTVVTPIIMDSSKVRQQNGKHTSTTDSTYDQTPSSRLPSVNSSFQEEKPRRSETLNKQQIPVSNQSHIRHLSSSHATSPSEDDRPTHWTKQILIPTIHLTDDEILSAREDQPRPQSPNVEQIAERNQPPSPPPIATSTGKKRSAADGQKRKEQQRLSRRSTSADSIPHIPLVDDKSLDSTSENNIDFDRHKRRHIKPKKKDVETNTDQIFDTQQQQRSFFDEKELSPQRPLKATKQLSDHHHATRRRAPNKEVILTTPDTIPDTDTPTVRRTVKQTKDSKQDKDPVHVNVTVVVKKFASASKDGTSHTTAEAFVEQKPQQYFELVQRPPEILPPPPPTTTTTTTENQEQSEELTERPKSTEQQRIKSSEEKILEHGDRHTQSDTEQIITDKQKKRRRPKRISRTCQTYEGVFRRMEREQQQDLRATSDTEKNIQTRKSQLRPRKKSPKKNLPVYLSSDSFRLEELLPKQYHQSRRNMSKSSSAARSLSPQSGRLLILRPTLPFHHTDAVNVHRVCLQYAIDLVPNENLSTTSSIPTHRNKLTVLKHPEHTSNFPMISASSTGVHMPSNKSNIKEKSASNKSEDYTHQRKNGGAV